MLLYREFVELPVIHASEAAAIREAIAAEHATAQAIAEGHTRAVPHEDVRPQDAQVADADVLAQVCLAQCGCVCQQLCCY